MSEEKKNFELSDDDLDTVNGGVFLGNGQNNPVVGIGGPGTVLQNTDSIGMNNQVASKNGKGPGAAPTVQQANSNPATAVPPNTLVSGGNYLV